MPIDKNTFCVAPWFSIAVDPRGELSPCCKIKKSSGYRFNEIEKYFKSDDLESLRRDLATGVKNKQCEACWKDEEINGDSLRLVQNRTFGLFSKHSISEQMANPNLEKIQSFELSLGNLCNLKCLMCSPSFSSQLLAELNLNTHLNSHMETKERNLKQKDFNWPHSQDFVQWCEKYLPQSIHIKMTGGEPFMIPWLEDVIDQIPDHQKSRCVLHFTTNLTVVNNRLFEIFNKFKEVWISVSCEGIWSTLDYIRSGHTWTELALNLKTLKNKNIQNIKLGINHVVQAISYHSILPMAKFFDSLDLPIYPIMLSTPDSYHISALTKIAKLDFLKQSKDYEGKNFDFIRFVRESTKKYLEQDHTLTDKCIKRLADFDKARHTDYKKVIPLVNLHRTV